MSVAVCGISFFFLKLQVFWCLKQFSAINVLILNPDPPCHGLSSLGLEKKKKAKIVLLLIETLIWEFLFISHNSVHFQIACFSTTAANDESEVLKEQRG